MFFEDGRHQRLDAKPVSTDITEPLNLGVLVEAELRSIAAASSRLRTPFNRSVLLDVLSKSGAATDSASAVLTSLRFIAPIARRVLLTGVQAGREHEREQLERWLNRLRSFEPLSALMVDLHYFAGLSVREAARVAGVSVQTALQDLRFAKSWLAAYQGRSTTLR